MAKRRKSSVREKPPSAPGCAFSTLFAIGLGLGVVTFALFARVGGHGFINYDDNQYVVGNARVSTGLSGQNILWAFSSGHAANWHPLTWISHMLDCTLFGLNPGPHHLVSVLLHAAAAITLLIALFEMTGLPWRSAIVAALFAWHPTHVESVAWVAERKDVLSGLFWMLTLLAYGRYVRRPSAFRYSVMAFALLCGLLSKPMVVTLPFVLLLLDYWPLGRLRSPAELRPLVVEKLPLFALVVGASVVTFLVQQAGGAVVRVEDTPRAARLINALFTYCFYLWKTFWPADLFLPYWYQYPASLPLILLAVAVLLGVTLAAVRFGRRCPYLPVGWLWYLGVLVPVIGLVQVGSQSAADRYTYLPSIGIFVAVVWGMADLFGWLRLGRAPVAATSAGMLAVCGFLTIRQVGYWKNSVTLFTHTLRVDPPNLVAMNALAWTHATDRDPSLRDGAQALRLATLTVEITQRRHAISLRTLGAAHAEAGQFEKASAAAREALALPDAKLQPHVLEGLRADLLAYEAGQRRYGGD